uniref:Ras-related protein Rab-43 n=1 Tax=Ascaris lumbricoides TaxID=6252 RepID=A0A9J2PDI4_ASCLU
MEADDSFDFLFKIVLIGDMGVGKTCVVQRFKNGTFIERQGTTIGVDFTMKTLVIEGKRVKLQIWDTGGQERFRTITQSYYRSANGIILCYDMTCRQSFESLQRWLDDVSKFAAPNVAKVLVGSFGLFSYLCQDVLSSSRLLLKEGGATKADLESERVVDSEEGNELAHSQGMCFFVETSARGNVNVENAFLELALQLKRHYEAGAHIDAQLDAFRISSQSTTTIASKWSSCCNFA